MHAFPICVGLKCYIWPSYSIHSSYGLACYGNTFKTYLDKIKLLQIRFMKILVDKNTKIRCKNSSYEELFLECKMLPVHEKVVLLVALEQYGNEEFKNNIIRIRSQRNRNKKICSAHLQ